MKDPKTAASTTHTPCGPEFRATQKYVPEQLGMLQKIQIQAVILVHRQNEIHKQLAMCISMSLNLSVMRICETIMKAHPCIAIKANHCFIAAPLGSGHTFTSVFHLHTGCAQVNKRLNAWKLIIEHKLQTISSMQQPRHIVDPRGKWFHSSINIV